MKLKVWLCQVNNTFGLSAFLPYSVGLLQAYALKDDVVREHYEFCGFVFLREDIASCVARMGRVDVFAASLYIWNANYTKALAKAVKEANPDCLIVLGGPHVPVRSEGFFQQHPWADVLIHYEGEETFREVLKERLGNPSIVTGPIPYSEVKGVSVRLPFSNDTHKTPDRPRMTDLDRIPSPYLTGLFAGLMKLDYDWHGSSETSRGCPYSCSFCDWGSNILAKVKAFSTERLVEEYDWMGRHSIDLLYNCDANYGILARDLDLTERMIKVKQKYGYPNKFRAAYAKNSNEKVFQISKMLNDAGMSKGTTLSFQSMDDATLRIVKRKNIEVKDFKSLMTRYREHNIPTYSEIIVGLPGETYDSFADGLDTLLEAGQHESINVYTCEVLPNSEMNHPEYKEKHGIKTVVTPQLFYHATPSQDPYREEYELVIETKALPPDDWMKCQLFAWIVQSFHCLGLTRLVAIFMRHYAGMRYREFYAALLNHAKSQSIVTVLYRLILEAHRFYSEMREGRTPELIDLRFGNITWPPEEYTYLLACVNAGEFYDCIFGFLASGLVLEGVPVSVDTADAIIEFQTRHLAFPREGEEEEWAKREVWYGRKGKTTLTDDVLRGVIQLAEECKKEDSR
jgi:radical SAM superfamily enzyme YgiQ (UPF0313 family)